MKSYISRYALLICAAGTMLLGGCSKFLDESDPSNFTIDQYYKTAEHAASGVLSLIHI